MEKTSTMPAGSGAGRRPGFWSRFQEVVSLADYRPRPAAGVAVSEQDGVHVLRNPQSDTYLRLSADEYALWTRMDGRRTVRELAVDYFLRQHRLVPLADLVRRLRSGGFLTDPPAGLQAQLQAAVEAAAMPRGRRLAGVLWGRPLVVQGVDRFFRALHRLGGRWLYTRPARVLQVLVALAGFASFIALLVQGRPGYAILQAGGSYLLGFLVLLLLNMAILSLHECAHALTTIHQGCQVPRGGFMLYLGLPTLFVDTTDTWMVGKKARIAVAGAGPWNDLVLGGLCALLALPAWAGGPLMLKVATLAYLSAFFNLNPLAELDGYYVLSDALELPHLRRDALAFVAGELGKRLRQRRPLAPRERLYAIYGLLAAFYLVVMAGLAFLFWRSQLVHLFDDLLKAGAWGRAALGVLAALVGVPVAMLGGRRLWQAGRRRWRMLAERGQLAQGNIRLGLVGAASTALGLLLLILPGAWFRVVLPLLPALLGGLTLPAMAIVLPAYRGASFRRALLFLAVVVLLLTVGAVLDGGWGNLSAGTTLARLAQVSALLAALTAFSGEDLVRAHIAERAAMGLLVGGGFVLAVALARGVGPAGSFLGVLAGAGPVFLGGLALALFVPTVVSFAQTPFAPSWILWALALIVSVVRSAGVGKMELALEMDTGIIWLMAQGATLYLLAQRYMAYPVEEWTGEGALGTHARLRQAFGHFYATLFHLFRNTFGRRRAQVLDDRLDVIAVTADWLIAVDGGRIQETSDTADRPLEQIAAQYRELLERTLDSMAILAGRPFLRRAIQSAYDGLPWLEREALTQHVLSLTPWGEAVSRDLAAYQEADLRLLAGVPLFFGCDQETLAELHTVLRRERVAAGRVLAEQGQEATKLWVVVMGEVEAWQAGQDGRERLVAELRRGDTWGEEVLTGRPYTATYRASVETVLLSVDKATLERVWGNRPRPSTLMRERAWLFSWMAGLDLFRGLPWPDLQRVAARMERRQVPAWETLVQEGQPDPSFYLIEAGKVLLVTGWGRVDERIVGERGPGEYWGEMAPLLGGIAPATVVTVEETALWALPAGEFRRLLERALGVAG